MYLRLWIDWTLPTLEKVVLPDRLQSRGILEADRWPDVQGINCPGGIIDTAFDEVIEGESAC
jgi:hypothetical protein